MIIEFDNIYQYKIRGTIDVPILEKINNKIPYCNHDISNQNDALDLIWHNIRDLIEDQIKWRLDDN